MKSKITLIVFGAALATLAQAQTPKGGHMSQLVGGDVKAIAGTVTSLTATTTVPLQPGYSKGFITATWTQ